MLTITSSYDIEKDAANRREAVNRSINGNGYTNMDDESQKILKKITGIPFKESMYELIPFLEKRYNNNKKKLTMLQNK